MHMRTCTGGNDLLTHYLKICFKMTYTHIKAQVFCLLLGPMVFFIILGSQTGWYIMDVCLSIVYAIMIYCAAYKIADKDIKSYSKHKAYAAKGLILPAATLILTFVLTLLYDFSFRHQFADYDIQMKVQLILQNLFKGWNFTFDAFRTGANGEISIFYFALSYVFIPVFSFLGYLAGMNRYEFGYKFFSALVYKKQDKNKN